ncbi:hypothetical protein [Bradyrhizobium sp. ORS 111]|uniref:hypothetical protein n=1 Tax=Bradyrhizobium sp. ORS 111 TaxID=1685958 RepID=UPI00388DF4BD
MPDLSYGTLVASVGIAAVYYFFARRRFDFLTVSLIGAAFYFSPLLLRTVEVTLVTDPTIPAPVNWIAAGYLLALVAAGLIAAGLPAPQRSKLLLPSAAAPCLALAVVGLIGAIATTRGAIVNADKIVVLKQVGYSYVLFEIAASLACIASVVERRWTILAGACAMLAIDLLLGFRNYAVLTAISTAFVLLASQPAMRLIVKGPTFGIACVLLVAAMLALHTARFAIFDAIAVERNAPRVTRAAEMRGDTLQFMRAASMAGTPTSAASAAEAPTSLPRWFLVPLQLFEHSEPFTIQATLVETVHRAYSCSPGNILKSLTLIPGAGHLLPSYPMTFYDEFQPALFPTVDYGLGGNIWAEMLCRFGYAGVVAFGLAMLICLVGMQRLFLAAPPTLSAPIAFSGVIIAFYIYRNDLHYTLVMIRQTLGVFAIALVIAWLHTIWQSKPILATRNPE